MCARSPVWLHISISICANCSQPVSRVDFPPHHHHHCDHNVLLGRYVEAVASLRDSLPSSGSADPDMRSPARGDDGSPCAPTPLLPR